MTVLARNISVRLSGRKILHELTMELPEGAMVGLLGPNGSGKSTLLRALWRALPPASGAVLIDEEDLASLSARERARKVAVLMQDDDTDARYTVLETVASGRLPHRSLLGADDDPGDPVGDALRLTRTEAFAERRIGTLSGGQRQRVLAARTLAQGTPVVLLDEPTNHLDLSAQLDLLGLFRERGGTVVAALHDLNLAAAYCDLLHLIDHGRLIASGAPEHVLTPDLIGGVFHVDAAVGTNPLTGKLAIHVGSRLPRSRTTTESTSP